MKKIVLIFNLLVLTAINLFSQNVSSKDTVVIIAGKLIDVKNASVLDNQAILIIGEYINKTGAKKDILSQLSENTKIINLESATVLPGLIDCHAHLDKQSDNNYYRDLIVKTPVDYAIESTVYVRKTLEAGFTTLRDLGSSNNFINVSLKKAINNGVIAGPRLQVAGLYIGATGGHADLLNVSPYLKFDQFSGVADGVDEIRKKVRFNIKNGADIIKIMLNGTILGTDITSPECSYSQEEINFCAEEAKRWGKNVSAHVHSSEVIKKAIKAGILSIEHASNLDDECIKLAKEHGTFMVPTIYWMQYVFEQSTKLGVSASVQERFATILEQQKINFKRMVNSGIKIAYGTDATIFPHGLNANQFSLMVDWGMDPMKAIQSATINASELLGWTDRVGVIEPGHYADIIAVKENPVRNIKILEQVDFVMKGGQIIKDNLSNK